MQSPTVFISYSHDSPTHENRVLDLADRLRADGIDATIDQYQTAPPDGWQLWMEKQIRDSQFVLLVCTDTYLRRVMKEEVPSRGLGVPWESTIIYQHLYNSGVVNEKFIPVVFGHDDTQYIPLPLQPTTHYDVSTDDGYELLYRRLTNQPFTPKNPLGQVRKLPPRTRKHGSGSPDSQPPSVSIAGLPSTSPMIPDNLALAEQAQLAIESSFPNQTILTKRYLQSFWQRFDDLAPDFPGTEQSSTDDLLLEAIGMTESIASEFARLSDAIAKAGASEPAVGVYKSFSHCLEHHHPPLGFSGTWYDAHGDYYRFLGHELFVIFVSCLITEGRWQLVANLLEEEFYVENGPNGISGLMSFTRLSDSAAMLYHRNIRLKLGRMSVQADLLNLRHTRGELSNVVPMRNVLDADFFLSLRKGPLWHSWSVIYMGSQVPRFLAEAVRANNAKLLLRPLNVDNIDELQKLIPERLSLISGLFPIGMGLFLLEDFDIRTIGSR
jgi:TIR domain